MMMMKHSFILIFILFYASVFEAFSDLWKNIFTTIYLFHYIYISSSSSCHAGSTDIPNPLSPLLPIVHRPRQVFRKAGRPARTYIQQLCEDIYIYIYINWDEQKVLWYFGKVRHNLACQYTFATVRKVMKYIGVRDVKCNLRGLPLGLEVQT